MHRWVRSLSSLLLATVLLIALVGCSGEETSEIEPAEPVAEAPVADKAEPLPDEASYVAVLAAGLEYSYGIAPEDGALETLENMDGYGAIQWTDEIGRSVIVTHRFVAGEPETWVYVDEGVTGDGVTELSPTGEQLQAYDALAGEFVSATGTEAALTRVYAWTSESGIGSAAYSTGEATDDPNLNLSFGTDELLGRADFTAP